MAERKRFTEKAFDVLRKVDNVASIGLIAFGFITASTAAVVGGAFSLGLNATLGEKISKSLKKKK